MIEEFKIQAMGRAAYLFTNRDTTMLHRFRTQREAAQAGKEMDRAVREAIEAVLARYPEVTR